MYLVPLQIKVGDNSDQKDVVTLSIVLRCTTPKAFKELIEYCAERKLELLNGCDDNLCHTVYGSLNVKPRGEDYASISWRMSGSVRLEYQGVKLNLSEKLNACASSLMII